jgi:peptidyl-prolyl cis-trans isomerase C
VIASEEKSAMSSCARFGLTLVVSGLIGFPTAAQPPQAPQQPSAAPAAPAGSAALVNGEAITTVAVNRALDRVPPARRGEARPEILDYLIDNLLIDQYLRQINIAMDPKQVDARLQQIREEIKKDGQEFDKVMQKLQLTEAELRSQIMADLRWESFAGQRATEAELRDLFTKETVIFDGTMVRARHILLTPPANDPKAGEQAKADLLAIKQQIDRQVAEGLAKLPATADNLTRQRERQHLLDEAFAAQAREKSACPSKAQGGDVNWFPRGGSMVEPFAKAAFAVKVYEMTDVVQTPFGYHLILVTDRKEGKPTKFEDVKDEVKEVYSLRLRDEMARRLRPTARVTITPPQQ